MRGTKAEYDQVVMATDRLALDRENQESARRISCWAAGLFVVVLILYFILGSTGIVWVCAAALVIVFAQALGRVDTIWSRKRSGEREYDEWQAGLGWIHDQAISGLAFVSPPHGFEHLDSRVAKTGRTFRDVLAVVGDLADVAGSISGLLIPGTDIFGSAVAAALRAGSSSSANEKITAGVRAFVLADLYVLRYRAVTTRERSFTEYAIGSLEPLVPKSAIVDVQAQLSQLPLGDL